MLWRTSVSIRCLFSCIAILVALSQTAQATSQTPSRVAILADIGITDQIVTWNPPPGYTQVSNVISTFHWDWSPNTHWPGVGNPAVSRSWNQSSDLLAGGAAESAIITGYNVTATGQTSYFGVVELVVVVEKTSNGELYIATASSYQGVDAYYNVIEHHIFANDWQIYQP